MVSIVSAKVSVVSLTFHHLTGVLLQLATVLGIFFTQLLGLNLATPDNWRYVIIFSLALGCAQWILAPFVTDTPLWLKRKNRKDESEAAAKRIWGLVLRRDDGGLTVSAETH